MFLPNKWKGSKGMTANIQAIIRRVDLLLEIVNAENKEQLSKEALQLL